MFHKVRELSKDLAIYGVGDVAISVINFALLPIFTLYLSTGDYGVLALLGAVEVVSKIVFRFGLDGAFMRFYYLYDGEADRQKLASTIFLFLLLVNSVLLLVAVLAAPLASAHLFGWTADVPAAERSMHVRALQLVLLNTYAISFTFFPFHLLRMQKRAAEFSLLTVARSISTLLLRIFFVIGLGFSYMGIVVADVLVTALLLAILLRWFAPLIRPVFSRAMLRESLAFGMPRVPHAFAQQVMAVGDRFILSWFRPVTEIGIYSMGATFGLTQKLFLSAFEYAWAPFYYSTAREADGQRVFAVITTYAFAVLCLMTAGLSATGADLLALMVPDTFAPAAEVITWTAVGVLLQGVYLLTSIGLNITKKTQYYPLSTVAAAAASIALNIALIPRFGIVGAAWANAAAYALQAAIAFRFSQRFYPIAYEWGRLVRVAAAALLGYLVAQQLPAMSPLAGVLARGSTVLVVTGGVLGLSGFFHAAEMEILKRLRRRSKDESASVLPPETTEFAGEIIASDVRDDLVDKRQR